MTLFQKGDKDINLRMMHGVNRISLFVFIGCLMVMAYRYFIR